MPEHRYDSGKQIAVLKVVYLLTVTMVTFIVPAISARSASWFVVVSLLAGQVTALLITRIPASDILAQAWRLKWLFLLLVAGYTLLPPENPASGDALVLWHPLGSVWQISINLTGLEQAALMSVQILTVLLTSFLVRATGTGRDLILGLEAFRMPALFVHALDNTLELLGGVHRQRGATGNRSERPGFFGVIRLIMRSDFAFFARTIQAKIETAAHRVAQSSVQPLNPRLAHDVVVVTGIAVCMASFKMLKILPGVPFAPVHKMVLIFPLYVIASRLTHSRWGATAAGSIMGVIGFLQGDGRFGLLEVLKHIAPGLVIDLCYPLARRLPPWALWYFILGLIAAVARTATEFVLILLLGARVELYIFPAVKLLPNLLAGFLSGFVTLFLVRVFADYGAAYRPVTSSAPGAIGQASAAAKDDEGPGPQGASNQVASENCSLGSDTGHGSRGGPKS